MLLHWSFYGNVFLNIQNDQKFMQNPLSAKLKEQRNSSQSCSTVYLEEGYMNTAWYKMDMGKNTD